MKKILVASAGVCAVALAFAAKDPVIMTVNGVDVPKSEFEYLYNKNSQQQINPQNLEEYVEMFKLYKLKVADARAEGIDTLPSFLKETEQYRHDLSAPYMVDSVYLNKLVKEAYDRSRNEAEAYHIMLFKGRDAQTNLETRERADSIRKVLLNGGDFAELAAKYSQDRSSNSRGGRMGYIIANNYPYSFDVTAFSLPEGEISEVVESPVGFHILKGGKKRPARGKVRVAHILKLTQGKDAAGAAQAKAQIDSLYNLAVAGGDFAQLATNNSDDRNSARQGGNLPLFGAGEMVEEFDSAAFALADGEISKPFATSYGWHIVKRFDGKAPESLEEMKPRLLQRMQQRNDPRWGMIRDNLSANLARKHKASLNKEAYDKFYAVVEKEGLDTAAYAFAAGPLANEWIAQIDGKRIPFSDFISFLSGLRLKRALAMDMLRDGFPNYYNKLLVNAEEEDLLKENADYRNLLKEYVDGSLLYEVSVQKVWDKASKDTEGLDKFFKAHRNDYAWKEPHAKGFLVQAANDSVAALVKARAAELGADTLAVALRKEFPKVISVDRVLAPKGTNAMVDNVMFGGPKVEPSSSSYTVYFMLNPRVITVPEEVSDVKGLVTSDYQNEFQTAWENELRRKYPVKVNEKVLKTVKRIDK